MKGKLLKDKKGISPVIATVIIVAVTIAVAIAVAFWMGGLVNIFTRFEKLEISSAYADLGTGTFTVTMNFKNTGSAAAAISDILLNGKPASTYSTVTQALVNTSITDTTGKDFKAGGTGLTTPVSCGVGEQGKLVMTITSGAPFVSGVSLEVTIHTAAGKDYPKVVVLP